jgi:nicotinamidase-related amidase
VTVACIAVDVQNDFTESGPFARSGHDAIARAIGSYVAQHRHHYDLVIAAQDWHVDPGDHFGAYVSGASSPSNKDRTESKLAVAGADIVLGNVVGP